MSFVGRIQCDQMVRLLFQYLAIYNNIEIFPNGIRNLSEYAQNFAKYLVDPLKFAIVVKHFAEVAKVWSHWPYRSSSSSLAAERRKMKR